MQVKKQRESVLHHHHKPDRFHGSAIEEIKKVYSQQL